MFGILFLCSIFMSVAFAVTLPSDATQSVDWTVLVAEVLANPKMIKGGVLGLVVVLVVTQFAKSKYLGQIFKKVDERGQFVIVTLIGAVYASMYKIIIGDESINAVILALISSGGSASIFKALKMLLGSVFPKLDKILNND